jgi:hypothetical protein
MERRSIAKAVASLIHMEVFANPISEKVYAIIAENPLCNKFKPEGGPSTWIVGGASRPAMHFNHLFADGKSQA